MASYRTDGVDKPAIDSTHTIVEWVQIMPTTRTGRERERQTVTTIVGSGSSSDREKMRKKKSLIKPPASRRTSQPVALH